jgi:hypothetical protein
MVRHVSYKWLERSLNTEFDGGYMYLRIHDQETNVHGECDRSAGDAYLPIFLILSDVFGCDHSTNDAYSS